MNHLLGAIVGSAIAFMCIRWSNSYLLSIQSKKMISLSLSLALIVVGATTGAVIAANPDVHSAMLGVVTSLTVVQTPLDLLAQRLARLPTLFALIAILVTRAAELSIANRPIEFLVQVTVVAVLVFVLGVFYRVSPQSLGWGDVLVAAPLAVAVLSVSVPSLGIWMLMASCSASIHGVVRRWRSGQRHLPFGPHLLGAAWLVMVFSL